MEVTIILNLPIDGVPATEDAVGARAGHANGIPEQEQDAGRGAAQPRAA